MDSLQSPFDGSRAGTLKALRESESKYRGIFEGSIDAICLLDAKGHFQDINPATLKLSGFSKAALLQKNLADLFANDSTKQHFEQEIANRREFWDFEADLVTAAGDIQSVIIALTCHRTPTPPNEVFFQAFLHNITRRKKAEKDLMIAEKIASTARLVRMLGHEIRNPLTNIDLAIGQILEENKDEGLLSLLEIIQRNSKRIGKLVTDLLQSSNTSQLKLQATNPNVLLAETLEIASDRIALKKITVRRHSSPQAPEILADPAKLKIALLNIILNAVEIVEESSGEIEVSTKLVDDTVVFSIKDNGPGIDANQINKIFDPYFSRKPNGIGLGLASTLSIMQAHRGRVDVQSKAGEGATFFVMLPVKI